MTSPADEPGFVHVSCSACGSPDVWLQCDQCKRRSAFSLHEDRFSCGCGASYTFAVCLCGSHVPTEHLRPVPFEKGPLSLRDLEVDWRKVAVLGAAAAGLVGSGIWLMLG